MIIDSVVWADATDIHRDGHTDSHVAVANAAPTHCVERRKLIFVLSVGLSSINVFHFEPSKND